MAAPRGCARVLFNSPSLSCAHGDEREKERGRNTARNFASNGIYRLERQTHRERERERENSSHPFFSPREYLAVDIEARPPFSPPLPDLTGVNRFRGGYLVGNAIGRELRSADGI